MKIMVGVDRGSVTAVAADSNGASPYNGTITLSSDLGEVAVRQLLLVTNIKTGEMYYNFADSDLNITIAQVNNESVITVKGIEIGSTVTTDDIQVIMEDGKSQATGAGLVTERHNKVTIAYGNNTQTMEYFFGAAIPANKVAEVTVTLDANGNVISLERTD